MSKIKTPIIFLFVFFSGFASLATEIIGPRLFSSLFGYTTQIWAAIISVTLLGISVGYYLGSRIPRERIPHYIPNVLLLNALWLLGISWIIWIIPNAWLEFGFLSVLLLAILSFFVPSVLFSMASPTSITLLSENRSPEWITRLVGSILAIGTLGSVLGALLAAYYLIPWIGLTTSLRIFAAGSVLFAIYFLSRKFRLASSPLIIFCLIIPQPSYHWASDLTLLEQREGYYQTIRVFSDGISSVQMNLGPTYQAVLELETGEPAFPIYKQIIEKMGDVSGKKILIIGGAGHTIARSLEKRSAQIVEVEIDPFIVEMSDQYFGPIQGEVIIADGRAYVDQVYKNQFDIVMLDAFNDAYYVPPQLTTVEFYQSVDRILKPGGRLFINLIGIPSGPLSDSFTSLSTTISQVFLDVRASQTQGDSIRNIMIIASNQEMVKINFNKAPDNGVILTDDLNPIEIFLQQAITGKINYRR